MKKILYITIVLFFSLALLNAQDWERYKSQELAFIADFPGSPNTSVQKIDSEVGVLDMHMVSYESSVDNVYVYYAIVKSDYPKEQFSNLSNEEIKSILDGSVDGAVTNVNGTTVKDEEIQLNGYLGRDVKINVEGGELYMHTFLVENVMYIAQVICETGKAEHAYIDKFMNAFDIIKVKQ